MKKVLIQIIIAECQLEKFQYKPKKPKRHFCSEISATFGQLHFSIHFLPNAGLTSCGRLEYSTIRSTDTKFDSSNVPLSTIMLRAPVICRKKKGNWKIGKGAQFSRNFNPSHNLDHKNEYLKCENFNKPFSMCQGPKNFNTV